MVNNGTTLKGARVAIYARYSSEHQNPDSIDDQVALCRRRLPEIARVIGEPVVFYDAAISGSTTDRGGLMALMKLAKGGGFTVLVMESLDRLSRNMADTARLMDILCYHGVVVWTVHEGWINELHIGVKGAMNALALKDMKQRVRRALEAKARAGQVPAGLSYGYKVRRDVADAEGKYINGFREIVPEKAAVIREIFDLFVKGVSVRQIVNDLNDRGIPSPRGGLWRDNNILGSRERQEGVLRKEVYMGVLVYNRFRKVINPETGKRKDVQNPESEWIRVKVSDLQIVDDVTWNKARLVIERREREKDTTGKRVLRFNRKPLTNLVFCGSCGFKKTMAQAHSYGCSVARHAKGVCTNRRQTKEIVIFATLLSRLKADIESQEDLKAEFKNRFAQDLSTAQKDMREANQLRESVERYKKVIEEGVSLGAIIEELKILEERMRTLESRISAAKVKDLPSERTIKEVLYRGLTYIEQSVHVKRSASVIQGLLSVVVEKIILTPVATAKRGENIEIILRSERWPEFYVKCQELLN